MRPVQFRCWLPVLLATAATQGCVFHASRCGRLHIDGQLLGADGVPVPATAVEVRLAADYGMSWLDRSAGNLCDSPPVTVCTDAEGRFRTELDVLHAAWLWVLPPLGLLPRRPPAPVLLLRADPKSACFLCVDASDGSTWFVEPVHGLRLLPGTLPVPAVDCEVAAGADAADGWPVTDVRLRIGLPGGCANGQPDWE